MIKFPIGFVFVLFTFGKALRLSRESISDRDPSGFPINDSLQRKHEAFHLEKDLTLMDSIRVCEGIDLPQPFTGTASEAYLYSAPIEAWAKYLKTRVLKQVDTNTEKLCKALGHANGKLKCNAIGMDSSALEVADAVYISSLYILSDLQQKHFESDFMASKSSQRVASYDDLLGSLRANGFARIKEIPSLNIMELRKEVAEAMAAQGVTSDTPMKFFGQELPSMLPILRDAGLLEMVKAYYGGQSTDLSGYSILHLGNQVTERDYPSGQWHHDRCGRRLKMFIYLDEVGKDEHPTKIVRGSHTMAYYGMDSVETTRFAPQFVELTYREKIETMIGPAGGGFILDTNTVHQGNIAGRQSARQVIILEFHQPHKGMFSANCMGAKHAVDLRLLQP